MAQEHKRSAQVKAMGLHIVQRWPDGQGERRHFGPFKTGLEAQEWAIGRRMIDGDQFAYTVEPLEQQCEPEDFQP